MLQHPLLCTHNLPQNVNYRKNPEGIPSVPAHGPGTAARTCVPSFWPCFSWRQPAHKPFLFPHHCFAARALQDQLLFHAQTSSVISLLSTPVAAVVTRRRGRLSRELCALSGLCCHSALLQLELRVSKTYKCEVPDQFSWGSMSRV